MLDYSKEKLAELGAEITTREIYQARCLADSF